MGKPDFKFDFSRGISTSLSDILAQEKTFKTLKNIDIWSKIGSAKQVYAITTQATFPTSKVYDKHIVYPVAGVGDYFLVMMTDGTIYSYTASGGFSGTAINSSASDQQAGAEWELAGEIVHIHYRHPTAPTAANNFKRFLYYDYDSGAFAIEDASIEERFTVEEVTLSGTKTYDTNNIYAKIIITHVNRDGSESFGTIRFITLENYRDKLLKITRDTDFYKARIYIGFAYDITGSGARETDYGIPQLIYEINGGSDNSFIPFVSGGLFNDAAKPGISQDAISGGTTYVSNLAEICSESVGGTGDYIVVGNAVRVREQDFIIQSIAYNSGVPTDTFYEIELESAPGTGFGCDLIHRDGDFEVCEIELSWDTNVFYAPICSRYEFLLTTLISDNRPDSKFTNATGTKLAFSQNKLFVADPFWPGTQQSGDKTEEKNGYVAWSFVPAEGYADSLIPETNLIASTITAAELVKLEDFNDNLIMFTKAGMARFRFGSGIKPDFIQTARYGISSANAAKRYIDSFFILSRGRVYMVDLDKRFSEIGVLRFTEIGQLLYDTFKSFSSSTKLCLDVNSDLLIINDNSTTNYLCNISDRENPRWITYVESVKILDSFNLNGTQYFVVLDGSTYKIMKYGTSELGTIDIETHDLWSHFENDYVTEGEIIYKATTGTISFKLYIDGTLVLTESLSTSANLTRHKFKVPANSQVRFNSIRWKIEGTSVAGFELIFVGLNNQGYGSQLEKKY